MRSIAYQIKKDKYFCPHGAAGRPLSATTPAERISAARAGQVEQAIVVQLPLPTNRAGFAGAQRRAWALRFIEIGCMQIHWG